MDYSTMEAGREMDRLVAERVMGWHIEIEGGREYWNDVNDRFMHGVGIENEYDDEFLHLLHFHPSESILCAWEVVEKLDNPSISLITAFGLWTCEGRGDTFYKATADTAPLAICRAALMAVK